MGYQFRPAVDGAAADPAMPTQSKPLHIIQPRMVELQTEYTREVIEALRLKDDPVLAMVEIENETSLVHEWQSRIWTATWWASTRHDLRRPVERLPEGEVPRHRRAARGLGRRRAGRP